MALIADIFLVSLIDDNGNVIATTTLQEANIDFSVTENEVRGGRGNQLLAILHADRDINISLTDAEFRYDWLAKQLGQNITTGTGTAYTMPKWYTVGAGGVVTLDETPKDTSSIKVKDINGEVLSATVTGTSATIATATEGEKVEVLSYAYQSDAETQIINIDNSVFAKGVKAILETLEIDSAENPTHKVQYQFDQAIPTGNFAINTASERTATTQAFNLRVVKPKDSNVVGRVLRIPVA